ncbi:NAD-dependent deacylase [Salinivibrio kushneri]|uniref:NAD-dependent deacylase n=1 Tax=Salinivibrio kushneri TaxID=1908198 RepID=UPI0009892427|nr:NAD-dependent deacylase [Salinivibrio kushneri]OOE50489.1 NAD-dependent protein deacylase [Salinivibrio kushneri]
MAFPYRHIVVLTGAGISAESGIRTFRDQDGLWEEHHIEDVATPEGFERNPTLVQQFYNDRRRQLQGEITPNPAHEALARLEQETEATVLVVTQNIDNLHERAGTHNIIHALNQADLFISIGTSGAVYPAAGFVHEAAMHGAHTIEINLEPSAVESEFNERRYGKASTLVPKLVEEILALEQ